ncbi:unnamed protein product [Clonostachys byssicola]|uniref:Uncharacterized protein n=1 Tax=Clonostachys byssicola TaxID=160290 RepID=A0A9N9UAB8_9HYPO|nr:unnamed protein product [Clonostachys byssicola]
MPWNLLYDTSTCTSWGQRSSRDRLDRGEIFGATADPGLKNPEVVLENKEDLDLHGKGSLEVIIPANVELLELVLAVSLVLLLIKGKHHVAHGNNGVNNAVLGTDELNVLLGENLKLLVVFADVIGRPHLDAAPGPGQFPALVAGEALEEESVMHVPGDHEVFLLSCALGPMVLALSDAIMSASMRHMSSAESQVSVSMSKTQTIRWIPSSGEAILVFIFEWGGDYNLVREVSTFQ